MQKSTLDLLLERVRAAASKMERGRRLFDEGRRDMARAVGASGVPAPAPAKKTKPASPVIEFGVDTPKKLSADEQTVLAATEPGPASKRDIMARSRLSEGAVKRHLSMLVKRKLLHVTGTTVDRRWSRKGK